MLKRLLLFFGDNSPKPTMSYVEMKGSGFKLSSCCCS